MAAGGVLYRLAAAALVLVASWLLMRTIAHAQPVDESAVLNAEVVRLHKAGKYPEATVLAERVLAIREKALGPGHRDVAVSLNDLALLYANQGRYADAEPLYRRSLSIREKEFGPDHPAVGESLNNLAELCRSQSRYAEAEPLYKRSLGLFEKALGPHHPDVSTVLNNLALLYEDRGRHGDAEPLFVRSLIIREEALGPNHPAVGQSLTNLAMLYERGGRYTEAEQMLKRSLAVRERALGLQHPDVANSLSNLAALYKAQGRYADAELLFERTVSLLENALGMDHPDVGVALNNLAELNRTRGSYGEAEVLHKRALTIREKAIGPDHPDVAASLNNLALLYEDQGRILDAARLHWRSLAIREKVLGPAHPAVAQSLNNLGLLYRAHGRTAEAETLLKRSVTIVEKTFGRDNADVATSLSNLALVYSDLARYGEAELLYRRSLGIYESVFGVEHPQVGTTLNNLAELFRAQGRTGDAEPLYQRGLAVWLKTLGPDHPHVGTLVNNLALLAVGKGDWAAAMDYWRRSTDIIKRRAGRGLAGDKQEMLAGEAQRLGPRFEGLLKATYRATVPTLTAALTAEMFETAQWAQGSEAAASLAQMAVRSARSSPELSLLVRERQDLVSEWQAKDKQLVAAKSEEPARRKADAEKALIDRLSAIDTRLAGIDARLAKDFPDYAALATPAPVSIAEVQTQLGTDEALVLFLDTPEWKMTGSNSLPEETFIWVVTKTQVRWLRSDLGTAALGREVAALRCGLDATAWDGDGSEKCAKALGVSPNKAPRSNEPLPFDHGRAHKFYAALFGEVPDVIKSKHLLIVPSGPLTQLPFQVLVRELPSTANHRAAAWLAREHAITILPAVSSLKALRGVGKPSAAPKPMLGIGNPLLDGPDGRYRVRAKLAREKQRCPETLAQRIASFVGFRASASRIETRGGLANVADIKVQTPLPETADELCAVAKDVKAGTGDILLGAKATERELKRLSTAGELAKYRLLHFATHGFLSGQLDGTNEPGLILTPPSIATEEDDGYLSASEIAALKLDADWVILSACNTAGGGATNAEALSGLARAFIYAQARALLVSHWEVYSDATVKLVTGALRELTRDPKVGRAEALRRSMLALIDKGEPQESHPAYWAPFVVVGEGAAAAR